ncbi:wings apart-like protein hypothetical protein [Limosa lapponica baueri]|uniref:Wings apart-like protein homolog n=1 Tax=Limosa lapponica baueri TaxID=1758121 RepID=A0A2I0TUN6_LIMLA|nr:wings apart-like protein hypothetical protein [Limosa lapponica baueri]
MYRPGTVQPLEYETGAKMTSRFGKTYSRKGGNGSSKFDEVFSNKRTTLSTKWGETTFMAKLGQKRPNKIQNLNQDNEKNSHFIYENAEDSNKTNAETTDTSGYNIEAKVVPDSWDSHIGKPADSPSETSQTKGPLRTHLYEWEDETEDNRTGEFILDFDNEHLSEMKSKDEECDKEDAENPKEAISEELVQTIPRPSNCRTYCRSNKAKPQGATNFDKLMDGTSQSLSKANNESNNDGLNPARKVSLSSGTSFRGTVGRTRDYTVLHPSCLSVCNVTIQDTMERIDEFTTAAPTDLGEAGRLRKKADIATTKTTTRFRPSNTKSKKDVKLEFFGFDDQDEGGGDEGASRSSGSSNYKIKYFGFDDLSESEDEDEEWQVAERKANKKRSRTAPSSSLQSTSESNENCSQDSQLSTNAAYLEVC